ncbi:carbohydrate sulfotransferase 11-like [Lytechinus pictus]|uniref:carbohydrate sulfotransferase 11-like n=1 Tax=Lytechinus pictus TaxID=7653 RepID=UPI0030BA1C1D
MARKPNLETLCGLIFLVGIACLFMLTNGSTKDRSLHNYSKDVRKILGEDERMTDSEQRKHDRFTKDQSLTALSSSTVEADRQRISILQQRKARLKEQCALIKEHHQVQDVALDPPEQLIVNEEYRIIYCNVPKVACTNWKTIFLELGGFSEFNTSREAHLGANKKGRLYLDYLHKYNVSQRRFMLQNYTKFVFVRHPFNRVLSAFRDKLAPNISVFFRNEDRKGTWISQYGQRIIDRYRGKAEADRVNSNWKQQYDLTFTEFIRFLVDPGIQSHNKHWDDIHSICKPCDINYDVIGKYETMSDDADFVLRLANIDPKIKFPKPHPSHVTNSSDGSLADTVYKGVPKSLMYKLAMLYAADFKLFGYDADPYLQI